MHRVVKAHLETFMERHAFSPAIDKAFEAFIGYCVLRKYCSDLFPVSALVYEGDDPGIDSIIFILDDILIWSADEQAEQLKRPRRNFDALIIFTQSKTGESWEKKINTFESAVLDFISDKSYYPHSEYISERKLLFDL